MNKIWQYGDMLCVTFQYSPRLVNAIREVDGRMFNKPKKRWEVPVTSVVQCVDTLNPLGFHIPPEVWDSYYLAKENQAKIRTIKTDPAPYGGPLPLYDFQKTGAAFIRLLPGSLLADAPGLGKTIQTAAAFEQVAGPILVLVPASLKFNWQEELKKWVPKEKSIVIHGDKQRRRELWYHASKGRAKWVIANYELLLRDFDDMNQRWLGIVCDEADRIANPFAKTTKLLKQLSHYSPHSCKRVALTGTPVSNSPEDLWSIADWISPRMLGTYKQFRERYLVTDPRYPSRIISYRNLEGLREKIEPIMLRRQKEEVLNDFPAKTVEHIRFDLSRDEAKAYVGLRNNIREELEKMKELDRRTLNIIPVKMLRLKQLTDHVKLIDTEAGDSIDSTKLSILKEMLTPIVKSGEKAIVFTQFSTMAKILYAELGAAGYSPGLIYGDINAMDRQVIVNQFRDNEDMKVIIMTEAGSYGLNLQAASYVFHYDASWSIGKLEQREGRAHRVGQTKPVTVYHLIARNTIDEYVLRVLKGKRDISDKILGDGEELEVEEQLSLDEANQILSLTPTV